MNKYTIDNNINIFGNKVEAFPNGIDEAFESLTHMLSGKFDRSFYGIVKMEEDGCMEGYYAMAEERFSGEAKQYQCTTFTIPKGEYLTETITSWRTKTATMKDVFATLLQQPKADRTQSLIEWYQNDETMLCMVKVNL